MSHFYASIQGSRGEATRTGGKRMSGHIRGWSIGCRVECSIVDGKDVINIYKTDGSSGHTPDELITELTE